MALGLAAVFLVARRLEPSPEGYGTHTQLGLPLCHFKTLTGVPCPSCGMTTAFAHSVRGEFRLAWRANPAGALLTPTCLGVAAWLLLGAALGRTPGTRTLETPLIGLVLATVALSLLFWMTRLFF